MRVEELVHVPVELEDKVLEEADGVVTLLIEVLVISRT